MSKVSSSDYPSYNSGSVSIGGSTATTGMKNGVLASNYNMSNNEAAVYDYALSALSNILPQLNTFNPGTLSSIQSEVDAYKNAGVQSINQMYNPMITELQNNIASRFGNLDNSIFADNLGEIESERAGAVSSFAQDVLAKQSGLQSDELTKRYALVELLSGLANNTYDNALSAIGTALGSSSSANSYNNNVYNALSDMASTNSKSGNTSLLLSNLLGNSGSKTSPLSSLLSFL